MDAKNEYKMQMFASGRYSVAHYLIHAMPPVSANAYMHFERNFRHGHVQLYCMTQWILTRAGHPKITSRWDGTGRNGEGTERGGTGEGGAERDETGPGSAGRGGRDRTGM